MVSVGAVVLLAAVGFAAYQRGRHGAGDEGDARLRQAALEQELTVLETRLRALERSRQSLARARLGAVPESSATTPPVSGAVAPGAAPPLPRPRQAPPATADDERLYFAAVEARHAGETRDPGWAEPIEQKLRRSAEGLGTRLTVELARCGRDMCRLDIRREVEPEADATAALQELVGRVVRVLPAALVHNTDDPRRLVVYLVRDGADGFPPLVGREPDPGPTSPAPP